MDTLTPSNDPVRGVNMRKTAHLIASNCDERLSRWARHTQLMAADVRAKTGTSEGQSCEHQ